MAAQIETDASNTEVLDLLEEVSNEVRSNWLLIIINYLRSTN